MKNQIIRCMSSMSSRGKGRRVKVKNKHNFLVPMDPHTHFMFPFAIGLILMKFGIINWKWALLAGVIGVLVDIDHYIEHIFHAKTNRFSLLAAWNNSIKFHRFNQRSFIHYGNSALLLTMILGVIALFKWPLALILALGYYSHLILDLPYHLKKERPFQWKIGNFYLKETHFELLVDALLFVALVILLTL